MTNTDAYRVGLRLLGIYLLIDSVAFSASVLCPFWDMTPSTPTTPTPWLNFTYGSVSVLRLVFGIVLTVFASGLAQLSTIPRAKNGERIRVID